MHPTIILCRHVSVSPFIYIMYFDGGKMKYSTLYYVFILTCKIWCFYWSFRNPLCVAPFKIKKASTSSRIETALHITQDNLPIRDIKKLQKKCLTSCDKRRMHTQAPANSGQGSYFMGPVWYLDAVRGGEDGSCSPLLSNDGRPRRRDVDVFSFIYNDVVNVVK